MKKLKTIIVDDEPLAVEFLRDILADHADVDLIGCCRNGREAVIMANDLRPELIILDIQMPGVNGFEVVKALQSDVMPMVIFVTAYDLYAIDAFDLHAVDYVLKPIDPERIHRAVERAIDRLHNSLTSLGNDFKTPLIGAISDISEKLNRDSDEVSANLASKLVIKDAGVVTVIALEDIDWVDAAGDYMCVHSAGETHIMRSTMKDLMAKLDPRLFARVHRSTVVNIGRVVTIKSLQKGGSMLFLKNGEAIRVSRNYRQPVLALFRD